MANKLYDKGFVRARKSAIKKIEALERSFGPEVFRSAARKFLENVRIEGQLSKKIAQAEKDLEALRKKKSAGR